MKSLSETWFADGYIDFELKKYTLLAYLQDVNKYFDEHKLYPSTRDVIFHYNNLVAFGKIKSFYRNNSEKTYRIQIQKLQLLYEQMMDDDELMQQLGRNSSMPHGKCALLSAMERKLYETDREKLKISPVGIIPLEQNEGYFFPEQRFIAYKSVSIPVKHL
jgi:hypothetical protein